MAEAHGEMIEGIAPDAHPRYRARTEPRLLLKKRKLGLPAQPPPEITAAPVPPTPLYCRPSRVGSNKLRLAEPPYAGLAD